jgi:hypothetical protein
MRTFRITFFTLLIVASAHAAIRVTPEIGIVDPVRALLGSEQSSPVVATDGDDFIVFWTTFNGVSVAGVNVAHVSSDGRLLSSRLAVPRTTGQQLSATWTGSVYLATWTDSLKAALFYATFSKTGDLLSGPVAIVGGMVGTPPGALASNGHRALLLYTDAGSSGLRAAMFDSDGSLIQTNVAVPRSGSATSYPVITSDGDEFALVWRSAQTGASGTDFHLIRIDENAHAVGSQIDISNAEPTGAFSVAFGGGRYVIATIVSHVIKPGLTQSLLVRFSLDARGGSVIKLPEVDTPPTSRTCPYSGAAVRSSRFGCDSAIRIRQSTS